MSTNLIVNTHYTITPLKAKATLRIFLAILRLARVLYPTSPNPRAGGTQQLFNHLRIYLKTKIPKTGAQCLHALGAES
jgi:hypothetical protein